MNKNTLHPIRLCNEYLNNLKSNPYILNAYEALLSNIKINSCKESLITPGRLVMLVVA